MKSVLIFIVYLILFYSCSGSEDEFQKKYCDPTLSDAKVSELEKCDEVISKEVRNVLSSRDIFWTKSFVRKLI
jgi:hypothetical protein